jgi:hypothetical protein
MNATIVLFALAGLGDVPNWMWLLWFAVIPFHLCAPLMDSSLRLGGTGTLAAVFQGLSALGLGRAAMRAFRARERPWFFRYLLFPIGYPIVMLFTNLLPAILWRLS